MRIKKARTRSHIGQAEAILKADVLQLGTVQKLTLGRPGNKVKDGKYFFR